MVTRWDPRTRAGAVAVRSKSAIDADAMRAIAETIHDWARYQDLAGDVECAETSPIVGTYDWKAYLQEETQLAQARDQREQRRKAARRPAAPASPTTVAPEHWYV